MKKIAIRIMLITVISKMLGLLRDLVLAYYYGASNVTDAYLISTTIPSVVFVMIGTGITASYIPIYTSIEKNESVEAADRFTGNLNIFIILLCTLVVVLCSKYCMQIVKLFASGFKGQTLDLAVDFTRITIFGIYFYSLSYVFAGYLNIKRSFLVPSAMGIVLNSITIVAVVLSSHIWIELLAYGTLIAMILQSVFLIPFVYKKGYRQIAKVDINNRYLRKMIIMAVPVILGASVNQINVLVDRTLASTIVAGGISALNYANKLVLFVQGVFVISLATAIFPLMSETFAANEIKKFKRLIIDTLGAVSYLLVPVTVITIVLAKPIIELLFGRGEFDSLAVYMTSTAFIFYSLGTTSMGIREILSKAFYAMQDTKTPMINAALGMAMNILLNIILSRQIGLGGLALATSIAATLTTCLLFFSLRKKIGSLELRYLSVSFAKIILASLLTGVIARASFYFFHTITSSNFLLMLITAAISVVSYITITSYMKIRDAGIVIGVIKDGLKYG